MKSLGQILIFLCIFAVSGFSLFAQSDSADPSVLLVLPNVYDHKIIDSALPELTPVIEKQIQSLGSIRLDPRDRSGGIKFVTEALNKKADDGRNLRDIFLESTNAIAPPAEVRAQKKIKDWNEILQLWESYSINYRIRFLIDPKIFMGIFRFPEIEDPQNALRANPVELRTRTQFWGTPVFKAESFNLSLTSDLAKDQFRLLKDSNDLLTPETSTIQFPQTFFQFDWSLLDYFKDAKSTDAHPRPIRLRYDGLVSNLDSINLTEEQAQRIINPLFKKEKVDEVIDVALGTKAFEETRKTLEAVMEYQIQRQKMPIVIWIEHSDPQTKKNETSDEGDFHFAIQSPEVDEKIRKLEESGSLYLKAKSEIAFDGVSDSKLKVNRSELEVAANVPQLMKISFSPDPLHPSDKLLDEIPDPTVRGIVKHLLSEAPKNPDLRIIVQIRLPEREAKLNIPVRWNNDTYELDTDHLKVQLPLMGKAKVESITVDSGKPGIEPFTLAITSGEAVFRQIVRRAGDFLKVTKAVLGDKPLLDIEKRIQSQVQNLVGELDEKRPIQIRDSDHSLDIKIKSFAFNSDHELHCDWLNEDLEGDAIPSDQKLPAGFQSLSHILPNAYQRTFSKKGSYEISCLMNLPSEIQVRLENIASSEADIDFVNMKLKYTSRNHEKPTIRLRLKVVYDAQAKRPILVPVADNIAWLINQYQIGSDMKDLEIGSVKAKTTTARAASGLVNTLLSVPRSKDASADSISVVSQVLGFGLQFYVTKEKYSKAEDKLRDEFENNKPYIYESISREVFEAINGILPATPLDPDKNPVTAAGSPGVKDPPFDPKNIGVIADIREGVADFVDRILATVPTGTEVQQSVESRVSKLVANSIEGREDGLADFPKQFTQSQICTLIPKAKAAAEDLVIHSISSRSKEWENAIEEAVTKPDPTSKNPESVMSQAEGTINESALSVLDPTVITERFKPQAVTPAVADGHKSFEMPAIKRICIYPKLYENDPSSELAQNFKAIGLFMKNQDSEGPTHLASSVPRQLPLSVCKERFCKADQPQLMISTGLLSEMLTTNRDQLRALVEQAIIFEKDEKTGERSSSPRFGISRAAHWEFDENQPLTLSVTPEGSAALDFGFRFSQGGLFTDIDTEYRKAKLVFATDMINRADENGEVIGYDLVLRGQKILFESRPGFRFNFTNFFLDKLEEEARKFTTTVPLDFPLAIPGMKFKVGKLEFVKDESGNQAIVTSLEGQAGPSLGSDPKVQKWIDRRDSPAMNASK